MALVLEYRNWRRLVLPEHEARPGCTPVEISALAPAENRQIVAALTAHVCTDGLSLAALLANPDPHFVGNEDIQLYVIGPEIAFWDVVNVESGAVEWTLWLFGVDCGAFYMPGTLESPGAYVTQGALWCTEDLRLWKALSVAHRSVRQLHPESRLAGMSFYGHFKCGTCGGGAPVWRGNDEDTTPCPRCGTPVHAA